MDGSGETEERLLNVTNATGGDNGPPSRDTEPLAICLLMTFIYSVILFTGCAGNLITCCIIYGNRHMHTATNYYLFSLAVSDLLLLLTGAPQEIVIFWFKSGYVFGGELFCVLRGVAAETSANATVLMITAFTVERYVAVCHPFLATSMSKLSRVFKIVVILWLVALSFAVPQALQFGIVGEGNFEQCNVKRLLMRYSFEVSSMLFFVIPMTVISVLYLLIWLNLRRTETLQLGQKHSHRGSFSDKGRIYRGKQAPSTSSRKLLKMLVAVVVAFFICWAPFHVQRIVTIHLDLSKSPSSALKVYEAVTYTSGILYYTSTTINPILYNIMSLKFRQAFKVFLRGRCGCVHRGGGGYSDAEARPRHRRREQRQDCGHQELNTSRIRLKERPLERRLKSGQHPLLTRTPTSSSATETTSTNLVPQKNNLS